MISRKTGLLAGLIALGAPLAAWAAPPARPVPLTSTQYQRLLSVQQRPEHSAVRDVRASYSSERDRSMDLTRASDDFWTVAYQGGMPAGILIVLICAAPL